MSALKQPAPAADDGGWTFSYGPRGATINAREIEHGVLQCKWSDPSKKGRDRRRRYALRMPVRKRADGPVDPRLEALAKRAIIAAQAVLATDGVPFAQPLLEAPSTEPGSTKADPADLTIAEGFDMALHPESGKYAAVDTRHYADMQAFRDILLTPGMLDSNLRWSSLGYEHVVALWRRMADAHKRDRSKFGARRAEAIIGSIYAVANWLRVRSKIDTDHALPVSGWRQELQKEWAERTGRPVAKPHRPRHSAEEALAIFGDLWHPERERYRRLVEATSDVSGGAVQELHRATRANVVRDDNGRPVALRLYVQFASDRRAVRVPLAGAALDAILAIDSGAADRPLFDRELSELTVDPRIELVVDMAAELRAGQMIARSKRSDLALEATALAPHGTLAIHGAGKKLGEQIALTAGQRAGIDRARSGYLALAEAEYNPKDASTDYHLVPAGKLRGGRVPVDRARKGPMARATALVKFHTLERAAGVDPIESRGWYGLRRAATDATPNYSGDARVLNKLGAWAPGSTTREEVYQDGQSDAVRAAAATVRGAWRTGAATAEPATSDTVSPMTPTTSAPVTIQLDQLPAELRAQVLAALGGAAAAAPADPSVVGTAVGTKANAAQTSGQDGAVSR